MTKNLLIVSADKTFTEVLLHGLAQEGYSVHVTKGKGESVVRADEENVSLAFLDMDLGYRAVLEIGQALRMLKPDIKLIVFSRDEIPPALDEIRPWTLSHKPYFLPEVLKMLEDNSPNLPARPQRVQTDDPLLPWLGDANKAAQHLTRL